MKLEDRLDGLDNVDSLQALIQLCQSRMYKIQSACDHPHFEVTMWSWRVGAYQPSRVCLICHAPIAGITEEEAKKVFDAFNSPLTSGDSTTIATVHNIKGDSNG
jgi:hypothetical protein